MKLSRIATRHSVLALIMCGISLAACGGGAGGTSPARSGAGFGGPVAPVADISPVVKADPGSALPEGWEHGGILQVLVRSYQDSDGDGHGDLRGLISRLDYLRDLGVKGLWLMPVHPSQDGDHGYAVTDYRAIDPRYGTLADFDELLRQAHARGMGVLIDYVINHSAAQHPLFLQSAAAAAGPYRDWYIWQNPAPAGWRIYGGDPWRPAATGAYFAGFSDTMPDFNLKLPAVLAFHDDNLRFWLNRGVDGLRFDAVGNLVENGPQAWERQPENYGLMGRVRTLVQGYTRRAMVCEAPGDSQGFAADSACGSAFAFDLSGALIRAARGEEAAIQAVSRYFLTAPATMATFLSNHDAFAGARVWDQLGGDLVQLRLAAAALLLLPGRPFLYYGEEVGMSGAATLQGDPSLRTPMSWTADTTRAGFTTGTPYRALAANLARQNVAAAQADPASLLAHYRTLLGLRQARASIARGRYASPFVQGRVMGFQRVLGAERTLVLINFGGQDATVGVPDLPADAALQPVQPPAGAAGGSAAPDAARLGVPAQSFRVWRF